MHRSVIKPLSPKDTLAKPRSMSLTFRQLLTVSHEPLQVTVKHNKNLCAKLTKIVHLFSN